MSNNVKEGFNATTNIGGIDVLNHQLADLIWQGVNSMSCDVGKYDEGAPIKINLIAKIRQAITLHHLLLGANLEAAEGAAEDYINFLKLTD